MSNRAGFDDFFSRYVAAVRKGDQALIDVYPQG